MEAALLLNGILAFVVLSTVLTVIAWAVRHSHHEGRPHVVAQRRQWMRHTISLHPHVQRPSRTARPFALGLD